jgi:hypothetical protein
MSARPMPKQKPSNAKVTMETSQLHWTLLDTARRRTAPGSHGREFFDRLERSLDAWHALTPSMIEACSIAITARSSI